MWTATIKSILTRRDVVTGAVFASGLAIGSVATYKTTQAKLRAHYDEIAKREINDAKIFYARAHKTTEETATPEAAYAAIHGEEALAAFKDYRMDSGEIAAPVPTEADLIITKETVETVEVSVDPVVEDEPVHHNVFVHVGPGVIPFDYDFEVPLRTEERPYIITEEEYLQAERDYEQVNLTYFKGDDMLIDERELPLPDPEITVGENIDEKFGYGSKNHNIVYVRNERLELDFEITQSTGKYSEEVLGFIEDEPSLKHSDRRLRKNQGYDG